MRAQPKDRRILITLLVLFPCCTSSTEVWESKRASNRFSFEVKGTLKELDGIPVLSLHGSVEEQGYAEGALLCGRMTRFFQDYYLDFLARLLEKRLGSYSAFRQQAMKRFAVAESDERQLRSLLLGLRERCSPADLLIRETADGPSRALEYEDLVAGHALIDQLLAACSSLTVWGRLSATGGTLHGRNLDFISDPVGTFLRQQMIKVFSSNDEERWAAISWPGNLGCPTCFTEDGSGLSSHGGSGPPSSTPNNNTLSMLAARDALLTAIRTDDHAGAAKALLDQRSTMTNGVNVHLFWDEGAAVLEYDDDLTHPDGRVTVRRPVATSLVCVPAYEQRSTAPLLGTNKAMHDILERGVQTSARGGMDPRTAWQLLADSATANELPTLHALVMDLAHKKMLLAFSQQPGQDANQVQPVEIELAAIFTD